METPPLPRRYVSDDCEAPHGQMVYAPEVADWLRKRADIGGLSLVSAASSLRAAADALDGHEPAPMGTPRGGRS